MLKRLKFKIVITNMLLVFVLILLVVIAVGVFVYQFEFSKIDTRLKQSINFLARSEYEFKRDIGEEFDQSHGKEIIDPPSREIGKDVNYINGSSVAVFVDENNEIIVKAEFSATMSEEALSYSINYAITNNKSIGFIRAANLVYRKISTENGTCIAFTDYEEAVSAMSSFGLIAGSAIVLVMLIVFVISIIVSSLSIKPVKKAWDSQKQFIADASHELKTPLTVILANYNILQSHQEDSIENQMQWIESTGQEATRMKQLVEQMLYLAKSETDSIPIEFSNINISEIVESSSLIFETVAFEKDVIINTEIEPCINLLADSQMFERVINILLDNAIKHAEKGSQINVSLKKEGKSTIVKVQNFGDCISQEDIPHIFDRFYKADKSRTIDNAENGFGLGLSIAKNIVEKLHGNIGVTSDKTTGTIFTLSF